MNKPITLAVEDFKSNMINLINASKLPFFVIEYTLKDLIQDVHAGHLKQFEIDKQKYEQYLEEISAAAAAIEKAEPQTEPQTVEEIGI